MCPAYSFGSEANGRYEVVFNWSSPLEPIVQAVNANPHARVLVLHFGRLARSDREWLRGWSIQHAVQFVTIDESLVLYLASVPAGTLRTLFDCALPFTCVEPFFTAPGLVPPESFFGRESERRSISEPYGSCFVYGGRQLGKTALLNSVQAGFHDPAAGHLARCIDLKVHDVGIARGADHIWEVLWRVLVQLGVLHDDRGMPPPGRDALVGEIAGAVNGWIDEAGDDRRILLLLDEADAFLLADLKNDFPVSTRLKGLMDETKRKFKVVFCGLHNVLRNTERANHPLAHFGQPICVGPLLDSEDLQQARALVREPLAAVGYAFESESLLTQILVWTNYYPSLIQLYGEALLRYLRQMPAREFPCVVTAEDVQAVFTRDHFRDVIRERFALTLQLDPRYEVIAYAMAYDLLQRGAEGLSGGLPGRRILELAGEVWPDGFRNPEKEFGTLLEEMCGLGVLRRRPNDTGKRSYAFRNPNVLLLLGDAENILDVLLKERALPDVFEASAFHAPYLTGGLQSPRRGPLTYEHEALLKRGGRVAVVCGTRAASLSAVPEFLLQQLEDKHFRPLGPCGDDSGLRKRLGVLRPDRGTYVYLVDDSDVWTLRWLDEAATALKKNQRGGSLRVVFSADPSLLWSFIADLPDALLETSDGLFDWVPAQPWNAAFLRRWCSDLNLNEASAKIEDLLDATGGWPLLLEQYAHSTEKTWKAKSADLGKYVSENRDELLDALGLGSPGTQLQVIALRDCGTLTPDDVEVYAALLREDGDHAFEQGLLRRRLYWAIQLGLVQEIDGTWSLNPLVARLLPAEA